MRRRWMVAGVLSFFSTAAGAQRPGTVPDGTPSDTQPVRHLIPVGTVARRPPRFPLQKAPAVSTLTLSPGVLSPPPLLGEGDLLRAVQLLPGVMARNDFNIGYDVRGGESDQNLVLLDGIPLYNPFHVDGVFGTFVDDAMGQVAFMSGAFPAQYGKRFSSILDVAAREDPRDGVARDGRTLAPGVGGEENRLWTKVCSTYRTLVRGRRRLSADASLPRAS